ncbi:MAG: GTP-binding protein [Microbacterium sp.]|uniref:GTP-binding protein n=1 Tax=Microbacterium sp. TaxID=51671 RepID=UPI001AC76A42|nr:GTP-binding protein [Microbacterium sp.]MBN9178123.1 GTP-binding protein [Microbacterium sp.]
MSSSPLVVVGICSPERRRYAHALGAATGRPVVRVSSSPSTRVPLARSRDESERVILDVDATVDALHLEPCLRSPAAEIICVVDAVDLLDDLFDDAPLAEPTAADDDRGDVGARARRAVSQLESASHVCIVNWERMDTASLSVLMSLVAHLGPTARARLSRGAADDLRALRAGGGPAIVDNVLERAGWVRMLNDEHDPYLTDPRVTTERYERLLPFHPERLVTALDMLDAGRAGRVVRSAGFCRVASRAQTLARWDQVGSAIWIDPLDSTMESSLTAQELVFTGIDLMPGAVSRVLDDALLTATELAAGPEVWASWADPLPTWFPAPTAILERDTSTPDELDRD